MIRLVEPYADRAPEGSGPESFDAEGRAVLFATQPLGYYCARCLTAGKVPYGARLVGSRRRGDGVGGLCDGCAEAAPADSALTASELLDMLSGGLLLSPEAEVADVWAERVRRGDGSPVLRVHVGPAVFLCTLQRWR